MSNLLLFNALQTGDMSLVSELLDRDSTLANATMPIHYQISQETDEVPLFTKIYTLPNNEETKKIRDLFLKHGANINHRFSDGSTFGHSIASISIYDFESAYRGLIWWIQDGGDVRLKNKGGDTPLKTIAKLARVSNDAFPTAYPGWAATKAILIGLNKCLAFPSLKSSYKLDTIAYRAFTQILIENGAAVNVENQLKGNLGYVFAMEAANRNDTRHFLRLIHWIRSGGEANKKDNKGMTPYQRLLRSATENECETFPGLIPTLVILANVEPDKTNDLEEKTDSHKPNS
jgi:hypothetical protein